MNILGWHTVLKCERCGKQIELDRDDRNTMVRCPCCYRKMRKVKVRKEK